MSDDGAIWIIKSFDNYCSNTGITAKVQFYSHGIFVVYLPCRVVCGWNKFPSYHHLLWKECLEGVLVEIGWFVWNVLKMAILRHNPPIPMSSQLRVPFPEAVFCTLTFLFLKCYRSSAQWRYHQTKIREWTWFFSRCFSSSQQLPQPRRTSFQSWSIPSTP